MSLGSTDVTYVVRDGTLSTDDDLKRPRSVHQLQ